MMFLSIGRSFVYSNLYNVTFECIVFLKFRLAYAESGASHQYYLPNGLWSYDRDASSFIQGRIACEKTKSYEVGFDLGMFNNKLNFSFTMYSTSTDSDIPLATYLGKAEIQIRAWKCR